MYLLKKLFQLRDKAGASSAEAEKPFLDHLEDLRVVVTRVVLTLIISTVICFVYRDTLMTVLRRPVDRVWLQTQQDRMPNGENKILSDDWDAAKKLADTIGHRPEETRRAFFAALNNPVQERLAGLVDDYRAAMLVPEERRNDYIETIGNTSDQLTAADIALLKELIEEGRRPDASANHTGDPREMSTLTPTEGFMLSMKLAFFAGVVISFPLLLYFILLFILPGLKKEEKRVLWPALFVAFGLFIGGVLFAYFMVLPQTLKFFYEFSSDMGISNDWRIGFYISFATQFTLLFGLAFELPVVVMAIVKLGLLRYETMKSTRAYAVLAITIAAAIITPTPDAVTLLLMALPMYLLYEACIWMAWGLARRERRAEEEEERQRMQRLLDGRANPPTSGENPDEPGEDDAQSDPPPTDDRDPHDDEAHGYAVDHPEYDETLWNNEDDLDDPALDAHGNYGLSEIADEGADEGADQVNEVAEVNEPGIATAPEAEAPVAEAPVAEAPEDDDQPAQPTP
jgi:sec-independent protein translocase protein TatC